MEHRCGTRHTLDVEVKLRSSAGPAASGRMLDASSSGAYIATGTGLPVMARIHVLLGSGGRHHRVAAYVVRTDATGIGIEWQEFAPPPLIALMDALNLLPSEASFAAAAARATRKLGRECQYIPLPHSNTMSCLYYHTCETRGALE